MRHILLILSVVAAAFGAGAQEAGAELDFVLPELPVIQICAVEEETQNPVPFVAIELEYADTIVNVSTDEKGLLDFTPLSFPLTLTATSEGMMETSYGVFEQPDGPLTILMTREPAEDKKQAMAIIRFE